MQLQREKKKWRNTEELFFNLEFLEEMSQEPLSDFFILIQLTLRWLVVVFL